MGILNTNENKTHMFKATKFAAALTLAEAARTQHNPDERPVQTNLGCEEEAVAGDWTWNGGKDGTINLRIKDTLRESNEPGNAHWDLHCMLHVDDSAGGVIVFRENDEGELV